MPAVLLVPALEQKLYWDAIHMHRCCCVPRRAVLTIQSYRRMLPVRRQFLQTRRAAVRLQAGERGRKARKDFKELKRRHRDAIKIQVGFLCGTHQKLSHELSISLT